MFWRRIALGLLVVAALVASCKDPTQIDLVVRSNVPFAAGTELGVWASHSGSFGEPLVRSSDPWLADGQLGNVVVTPESERRDAPITLRLALGLRGRPAATCTDDGDPRGCIIARRQLQFVPRTRLKVPVVMYLACEGVKCDANSTCSYLGTCVPAAVDANACSSSDGCALPGEPAFDPTPRDAGQETAPIEASTLAETGTDAGFDSSVDATPEAGPDAAEAGAKVLLSLQTSWRQTCANISTGDVVGKGPVAVKCWGSNSSGELGIGDMQTRGNLPGQMGVLLPEVDLGAGHTPKQLAGAGSFSCALTEAGRIKCWGQNNAGELGLGDALPRGEAPGEMGANLPTTDLDGLVATQITTGFNHVCARTDQGAVKCWGQNNDGRLGLGDMVNRGDNPGQMGATLPAVDLAASALEVAAGYNHSCARLSTGNVKCWGRNADGQLGLGDTQNRGDTPGEMGANLPTVDLGAGRKALQLVAGAHFNCARLDNSQVKCWGENGSGQLGLGDTQSRGDGPGEMGDNLPALDFGPGRTAVEIFAGGAHACALLDDNSLKCWGLNGNGQLGLGDAQSRGDGPGEMGANLPPVDLGANGRARLVSTSFGHTCARLDDGAVKCWGANGNGQLGLGDSADRGRNPGQMGANLPPIVLQ